MRKTKIEAQKTRQYILNAALDVFYEAGVTDATLQAIAQKACVTRGALYWYFNNKEDLFEEMCKQKHAIFLELLNDQTLNSCNNVWAHLKNSLLQLFTLISTNEQQKKFCIIMTTKCERTSNNKTITNLAQRYHKIIQTQIQRAIELSIQQGSLPAQTNPPLAVLYLESNMVGLIYMWANEPERFDLSTIASQIIHASMQTIEQGMV